MKFKNINGKNIPIGAGIAIFKISDSDEPQILCLRVKEENDIPKGIIEEEEAPIVAAIRETQEEAGLFQEDYYLLFSKKQNKLVTCCTQTITCFIGKINEGSEPQILANPKSGIYEHDSWAWLDKKSMLDNTKPYLKKIVEECFDIVNSKKSFKEGEYVYI